MISDKQLTHISKFLSLVLRHRPETIDIQLDKNGWAGIDELIEKATNHGIRLDREALAAESVRQMISICKHSFQTRDDLVQLWFL